MSSSDTGDLGVDSLLRVRFLEGSADSVLREQLSRRDGVCRAALCDGERSEYLVVQRREVHLLENRHSSDVEIFPRRQSLSNEMYMQNKYIK